MIAMVNTRDVLDHLPLEEGRSRQVGSSPQIVRSTENTMRLFDGVLFLIIAPTIIRQSVLVLMSKAQS